MAEPATEKQPENRKTQPKKPVIAEKVTGVVKWFNVKCGYGFINRNDTKEDVFVHQTAVLKNNPQKAVRSVGDGEVVEFDVVEGEKGHEAANVTGPNGDPVKGSSYAADRRGRGYGYPRWGYRPSNRPPRPPREDYDEERGDAGSRLPPVHFRIRPTYRTNYYQGGAFYNRGRARRSFPPPGHRNEEGNGDEFYENDGNMGPPRRGRGGPPRRFYNRRSFRGGFRGGMRRQDYQGDGPEGGDVDSRRPRYRRFNQRGGGGGGGRPSRRPRSTSSGKKESQGGNGESNESDS